MRLVYVFDAYCGWSYGFSPALARIVARHREIQVDVVSGGLFTGPRRVAVRELDFLPTANARITTLTGVRFGDGYARTVADGTFVMDSEAAARGMAALREAAPQRAVELAVALQRAFFVHGHSLSIPATYRMIAEARGLDAEAVVSTFRSPAAPITAEADFRRAAGLGVDAYPTLLALDGGRVVPLARGHATVEEIEHRLAAIGAGLSS
jgi:putative protein-disulfide isomerase